MPSYSLDQKLKEGAAEFFSMYIGNPGLAQQYAPNYYAEIERVLALPEHKAMAAGIKEVQALVYEQLGLTPAQAGRMVINRDIRPEWRKTITSAFEDWTSRKGSLREVAVKTVDSLAWLRRSVEEMAHTSGEFLKAGESAYNIARVAAGSGAMAQGFMEEGVFSNGARLGPSLREARQGALGSVGRLHGGASHRGATDDGR
jgi:hypothetical protein